MRFGGWRGVRWREVVRVVGFVTPRPRTGVHLLAVLAVTVLAVTVLVATVDFGAPGSRWAEQPVGATVPRPAVTTVGPDSGSIAGGQRVAIVGTNLTSVKAVTFGSSPSPSFSPISATEVVATTPPATTASVVPVTVTTASG